MGAASSDLQAESTPLESTPSESSPSESTPYVNRHKVLDCDPRSPSGEVLRTPIVVDKTPEFALDPRSPTCGIDRTPIVLKNEERAITEPKVLTYEADESSLYKSPMICSGNNSYSIYTDNDSEREVIPNIKFDISQLEASQESGFLNENVEYLNTFDPSTTESNQEISTNISQTSLSKRISKKEYKIHPVNNDIHGNESKRSPLKIRNVASNTPRSILQQKQVSRLGLSNGNTDFMSSQINNMKIISNVENDKENL